MHLLLLLAIPGLYVGLVGESDKLRACAPNLLKGVLVSPAGVVGVLAVRALAQGSYRPLRLYVAVTLEHHVLLYLLVIGSWVLLRGYRALEDEAGRRRWHDFLAFSAGFYAVISLVPALSGTRDLHDTIVLPLVRGALVVVSSVLVVLFFESYGIYRFLYATAAALLPLLAGLVSYLAYINLDVAALVLTGLGFAGSLAAWFAREH